MVGKKGSGKEEKRKNLKKEKKKKSRQRRSARSGAAERRSVGRSVFCIGPSYRIEGEGRLCEPSPSPSCGTKSLSCVCVRVCVYTHPSGRVRAIRGGLVLLGGSVKNDEPFGSSSPSSSFCCCVVQFFLIRSETIAKLVLRQCVCVSLCVFSRDSSRTEQQQQQSPTWLC